MLTPSEIAKSYIQIGIGKAKLPPVRMFLLAVFAGIFVAIAGAGATIAAAAMDNASAARIANALVFPSGLAMVLIAGSELFTGNSLMIISVIEKKISVSAMLKNWVIVYFGNLVGSLFICLLFVYGHTPDLYGGALAQNMVNTAAAKATLSFQDAFIRGILCNVLVCIAVWMAAAAKTVPGKIVAIYPAIVLFVLGGYEHCVANMFCIPSGLMTAAEYGITAEGLTVLGFLRNLLPVTLGNIIGGMLVVGCGYWLIYLKDSHEERA